MYDDNIVEIIMTIFVNRTLVSEMKAFYINYLDSEKMNRKPLTTKMRKHSVLVKFKQKCIKMVWS